MRCPAFCVSDILFEKGMWWSLLKCCLDWNLAGQSFQVLATRSAGDVRRTQFVYLPRTLQQHRFLGWKLDIRRRRCSGAKPRANLRINANYAEQYELRETT